jgi:hypothetical protein
MASITTAKEINLIQLDNELGNFGLSMNSEDLKAKVIATSDGSPITEAQLEDAIKIHDAVFTAPSIDEKLASVGLSVDDLKAALGL